MPIPVPGRLAEVVRQSVVKVRSGGRSLGSGVVIASGKVVTNAHVLVGIGSGRSEILLETWDGSTLDAEAVRANSSRDLALLSVAGLRANALPFGDWQGLQSGLPVFAIGNPFGFVGAVSSGVIRRTNVPRWICADVQLAPGNSGGPLVSFSGLMVGLNTMVVSGGLALAIPSRDVEKFLKHDNSRSLGVSVQGVDFRGRFGLLITGITPNSAADSCSLLPGDIVTEANGTKFTHADDLSDAVDGANDGLLHLEFFRGDGKAARHVTANLLAQGLRPAA